jgi:integrase/recombinase XerD
LGQRGALKSDAINTLLEKYTKELELGIKLKTHTFRHTFCTRFVSKGGALTTVSKLAGHSSIEITAKPYINSSKEEKMRAVSLL